MIFHSSSARSDLLIDSKHGNIESPNSLQTLHLSPPLTSVVKGDLMFLKKIRVPDAEPFLQIST